ncbi:MAG: hypothetical protein AABX98_01785 [Nanoarchaeota archaeon]
MKSSSNEKAVLLIVTIIGVLGVVALLFNAVSGDMTGQATSLLKISKPAIKATCTDSDGMIDSYTLGKAGSYTDVCKDADTVTEAYCDGTSAKTKDLDCKFGYCLDGVCLTQSDAEAYEAELAAEAASTCTDSDNGQDYFIGGIATVGAILERDYCLEKETEGYHPGYLYETYCENNLVTHEIINCEEHGGLDCTTTATGDACREQPRATTSGGSSTGGGSSGSGTSGKGSTGIGLNLG